MSEKNIVLSLDSGTNFPIRPGSKLEISAKLDNVVLQTDQSKLHSDKNPLLECELVWETSKALLTALRTKRACVRVDVFIDQKLLGYLVLDVRSSPVVSGEDDPPLPQAHLLQGAGGVKPAPVLNAVLYIETEQGSPAAKPSKQITAIEYLQKRVIKDPLKPVLVEDKGYFQIGESLNSRLFHLKVAVLRTENLHMLLPDLENKEQEFKIVYDLLGTELHASPGEIATAKLNASKSSLVSFLSSYGIQMNIVTQDKFIGTADIDVSNKLSFESEGFPVQYSGDCPIIAYYNMATPRDKDGQYPFLTIFIHLDKLAHNPSPTAIDHQSIDLSHISEGELSEVISEEMNRGTPQQTSPEKPPVKAPSNQPVENEGRAESELAFRRIDDTVNNIAAADDTRNSESRPIPQFLPESNADVIREDVLSVPLSPPTKLPRELPIHQRQSSSHPSGNPKVASSHPPGHQKVPQSLQPTSSNLKETYNVLCDTRESSILPGDETDYKSPPSTRASSNQNTFEFGPDVKLPRKMIICVESIRMLYNYTDLVLWYEYPHLSSSRISTEPMKAGAGNLVNILDASVEYNFLSTQVQLTAVFTEYKLKIFVASSRGDSTQQVGVSSVGIDQVLHIQPDRNGIKRKNLEVTIVSDKGAVGYLNLTLSLQTFSPRQSPSSRKSLEHSLSFGSNTSINASKSTVAENNRNKNPLQSKENILNNQGQGQNSQNQQFKKGNLKEQSTYSNNRQVKDRLLEMEMLAQVAKELETWKINEQKKFKDELSKKECQQMSLLGREWQDREKERVEQYNTKLQMLQQREEMLEKKLAQTEVKEKETTELKKSLEEEQTKLKQGKVDTIQKLRKEIRTKETEISQKDSELQVLKAKLNSTEQQFSKLKSEKEKKKDTQTSLQVELRRSGDDVMKLQTQLEIRTRELELMESQKDSLYKENQDLKAEQQTRMQELLSHLKLNKNMLEPSIELNTGQLRPNASHSPTPRPSSSVRSGGGGGTSRSLASKTPDTQVELMPQQRTSSPYPSSSGKNQSTTPRDVKDTLREAKDTPREVKVLKDIRRMERDRDMMLRAGYLQDDDVIRMFEEKIAALYQGIRNEAEEID